jgi:glycosyltransferase involved in cell wall biosynthesis
MAKVLVNCNVFSPDDVSIAYMLRDLVLQLKEYGHEITVLTSTPHYNVLESSLAAQPLVRERGNWLYKSDLGGIPVYHIKSPPKTGSVRKRIWSALGYQARSMLFAWRDIRRHDLVLSESAPPLLAGFLGSLLARKWRARSVYVLQDIFPDGLVIQGRLSNPVLLKALRLLERYVYNCSDVVVIIAESFRSVIASRMRNQSALRLIPNFVDTEFYRPLPRDNELRAELGLGDRFVVSYAGNIGNAQDFTPVLIAAERLRNLPISFVIVGDGIKKESLRTEVARKGLESVILLDYQPRERVPLINAASDLCAVLLDEHVQGFGFPSKIYTILASARVPIVWASPQSDLKAVVDESHCGRFVTIPDVDGFVETLHKCLVTRESLEPEGLLGRKYVERAYTKEAVARVYDGLILELTQNTPTPPNLARGVS